MTDAAFILAVLEDGLPHSHADLLHRSFTERGCGMTIHSRIAGLRDKGHVIECRRIPGAERGHAWTYRLLGSLVEAPDQSTAEPSLSVDGGSQPGHANGGRLGVSTSEPLFEVTDYGMGDKPPWA